MLVPQALETPDLIPSLRKSLEKRFAQRGPSARRAEALGADPVRLPAGREEELR